jgi:hypothetical protein
MKKKYGKLRKKKGTVVGGVGDKQRLITFAETITAA